MLSSHLFKGFDKKRLRNFLILFFLALAIPTAVLIWQAYSQLKWEAFHELRGDAEELTQRIDQRINALVRAADEHTFADYAFLVVSGDPSANFVQRSPLSAYPVDTDMPGVLGYFQVDTDGKFSTPLLPPIGTTAANLGISENEYVERTVLAQELQTVLVNNKLVRSKEKLSQHPTPASDVSVRAEPDSLHNNRAEDRASSLAETKTVDGDYNQSVFDRLTGLRSNSELKKSKDALQDIGLQEKSEANEARRLEVNSRLASSSKEIGRTRRTEQSALPETVAALSEKSIANIVGVKDLRVSTFESEIEPFEFSLLNSGHFVLFRNVWRDSERHIQGMILDQKMFTEQLVSTSFMTDTLANMTNLNINYQGETIQTLSGYINTRRVGSYSDSAEDLNGTLLYRNRLSAPLDSLELVYSVTRLPPGPGANVLDWATLVLAIVLLGGFLILYRTGLSQIDLSRQQQDFVSAVSHELKSPLTSIRMYGEMLKEGWADKEKQHSYYEYIHDEAKRLSRLISNVLQLAQITRNEPQFDRKSTTVAHLLSVTESKVSNQIERAGFKLHINAKKEAADATIHIDEDCFVQMIINLVDNAIKFSKNADNKTIEINSELSNNRKILFSVRDYGPGIPKDQMKKIFQLFYRSESELTRETVGTGIGLAIVHQLTLAMDGKIDMINAEPGAEFRIWFPISQ